MAIISGNQKVAVAHASTTIPSMNGATRSIRGDAGAASRRFDPASTVMATAPAAIHAGGSASVGSSSRKVHRRKIIVITIRYSTRPRVKVASAVNANASPPSLATRSAATTAIDSVATVSRNHVPLIPDWRPGLPWRITTAISVAYKNPAHRTRLTHHSTHARSYQSWMTIDAAPSTLVPATVV